MTKRERERIEKAAHRLVSAVRSVHGCDRHKGTLVAQIEDAGFVVISFAQTPRKWLAVHLAEQMGAVMESALKK